MSSLSGDLDELLRIPPYSLREEDKEARLLALIRSGARRAQSNIHIRSMYSKLGVVPEVIPSLSSVPAVPVRMFKDFDLATCAPEDVIRVLRSSGTTSQRPSVVPLDKATASNQTKALRSILGAYLGERRRVMLVIDHPGVNAPGRELSARGAGVRGLSIFAREVIYLLREEDGRLVVDEQALDRARELSSTNEVYVFGFTFIIWSAFCAQMEERGWKLNLPQAVVFHGGGWKKLKDKKVGRGAFSARLSSILGCDPAEVRDFYGMAEQTGVIFVDCELGRKHVPAFGQVIIRDVQTLKECPVGKRGLIEVMSVLGESYYGQAVLTEDAGTLLGIDDCPCGRKGRYFVVEGRAEQAEARGCGDTFRER
ncbi:MAG: hypothetical protein ISF22_01240 [Methanomassiliicoccus sp.]|nr:hypothetical protein [Methanomassiliicoccus sp.]